MRYFDTSVLLKLYVPEPRSAEAAALVAASQNRASLTDLHLLELHSALRQKMGRGELSEAQCRALMEQLKSDIGSGTHSRVKLEWHEIFALAEALSAAHGTVTMCRSLDTLHVATAIHLGCTEFCSFDRRQALLAAAAGLVILG